MAKVTIKKIISQRQPEGKQYVITQFLDGEDKAVETLARVEEGKDYEGDVTFNEQYKKWQFKKPDTGGAGFRGNNRFGKSSEEIDSIVWQTSLKAATEVVRDWYKAQLGSQTDVGLSIKLEDYAKEVDKIAVHFHNLIVAKPKSVAQSKEVEVDTESVNIDDLRGYEEGGNESLV